MAVTIDLSEQTIDPADALWTLFLNQPKKIQEKFVSKIANLFSVEPESLHKLTYAEINERLDQVEKDILSGNTIASEDVHQDIESKCPWNFL